MRRARCYRSRRAAGRRSPAATHQLSATETRIMMSAKRNNQIQASDLLMLVAVAGTILGGLFTLLA
jgi:hypothetical protein